MSTPIDGHGHSVVPGTGHYGPAWPSNVNLPQGSRGKISVAGWTKEDRGFVQQTFLGASIRNFSLSAGFGESSSSLSVALVEDEYNTSDGLDLGLGDDPYHNGLLDGFNPPGPGSPVFFKFGRNFATVEEAWKRTYDTMYGTSLTAGMPNATTYTVPSPLTNLPANHYVISDDGSTVTIEDRSILNTHPDRGYDHFVFGGILQSFTENMGNDGAPLYNVQVSDPREILSNCELILKNYTGTTFSNANLFNIYGFLECEISQSLKSVLGSASTSINPLSKNVSANGDVTYSGDDTYSFANYTSWSLSNYANKFPITGTGFSRSSEKGIPIYRVVQAINALFEYNGTLPDEYKAKGFGGVINFRGHNYVVDLSALPVDAMPALYSLNYDKIDLLSFISEICDTISHDFLVSLAPITDHPSTSYLYNRNAHYASLNQPGNLVAGIIRIDIINRSQQPQYGAIQSYINTLQSRGLEVESRDLGYEVSNVTTDKFVVGAQEVGMYYFTGEKDRDTLELKKKNAGIANNRYEVLQQEQWELPTMLNQQIIPFYGFLGKNAVTIPKGFGAYKQIMLDTSGLEAFGVGNYYIATEMELRCAAISYERWKQFLLRYCRTYLGRILPNFHQIAPGGIQQIANAAAADSLISQDAIGQAITDVTQHFGVTVPRCVFISDKNYMEYPNNLDWGNRPANACAPPYGYPLYLDRAHAIGIFNPAKLDDFKLDNKGVMKYKSKSLQGVKKDDVLLNAFNIFKKRLESELENYKGKKTKAYQEAQKLLNNFENIVNNGPDAAPVLSKNYMYFGDRNARRIYDFIKNVADECLGKKFLVKIPNTVNSRYSTDIRVDAGQAAQGVRYNTTSGPYGFPSRPLNIYATNTPADIQATEGALKGNFDVVSEQWKFNYKPEPAGGFFNFAQYDRTLSYLENQSLAPADLPLGTRNLLTPLDLTNFVDENGRIGGYVRFNDSQTIDFSQVGRDSIATQKIIGGASIPDLLGELEQGAEQQAQEIFSNPNLRGRSVTYMKVTVDDKLYLAPKVERIRTKVHGETVYGRNVANGRIVSGKGTWAAVENGQEIWLPSASGGVRDGDGPVNVYDFKRIADPVTGGNIVSTFDFDLNPDAVYALITFPARLQGTQNARFRSTKDGQSFYGNIYSMDVVQHPHFTLGNRKKLDLVDLSNTSKNLKRKRNASKLEDAINNLHNQKFWAAHPDATTNFESPAPVYPDLVVLPLLSYEHTYGPWLSSATTLIGGSNPSVNIGGKMEFIKDENLAPWNYGGYKLMNEAGSLKAQYSNSLLLSMERGSFTYPSAPFGLSIGQSLQSAGPLVTSISVNIGDSIKTTVKMDLYTARFGKLQKHKEDKIAEASRKIKELTTFYNDLKRKFNISEARGAHQTKADFQKLYGSYMTAQTTYPSFIVSAKKDEKELKLISDDGERIAQSITPATGIVYGGSVQEIDYMKEITPESYKTIAGGYFPFEGYSEVPNNHAFFPTENYVHEVEIDNRIFK